MCPHGMDLNQHARILCYLKTEGIIVMTFFFLDILKLQCVTIFAIKLGFVLLYLFYAGSRVA